MYKNILIMVNKKPIWGCFLVAVRMFKSLKNQEYKLAKVRTEDKKVRTEGKKVRTENIIMNSSYSLNVKNNMDKIYIALSNTIFSPKDLIELLDISPNTATKYISKFKELDLLEKVEGIGQSKFKFKE